MRVPIAVVLVSLMLAAFAATGASAARNPNPTGTGQPTASCDVSTTEPAGFSSPGFVRAEDHYANPGVVPVTASSHAVSQYDVACYQQTTNHG
jgi:hypothetical protein